MQRILGWAIDGLLDLLQAQEFVDPVSSEDAVRVWIDASDTVGQFLAEECNRKRDEFQPVLLVKKKVLYAAYREWGVAAGHSKLLTRKNFELALAERGIREHPSRSTEHGRCYEGVELIEGRKLPNPSMRGDAAMNDLSWAFGLDDPIED